MGDCILQSAFLATSLLLASLVAGAGEINCRILVSSMSRSIKPASTMLYPLGHDGAIPRRCDA